MFVDKNRKFFILIIDDNVGRDYVNIQETFLQKESHQMSTFSKDALKQLVKESFYIKFV